MMGSPGLSSCPTTWSKLAPARTTCTRTGGGRAAGNPAPNPSFAGVGQLRFLPGWVDRRMLTNRQIASERGVVVVRKVTEA